MFPVVLESEGAVASSMRTGDTGGIGGTGGIFGIVGATVAEGLGGMVLESPDKGGVVRSAGTGANGGIVELLTGVTEVTSGIVGAVGGEAGRVNAAGGTTAARDVLEVVGIRSSGPPGAIRLGPFSPAIAGPGGMMEVSRIPEAGVTEARDNVGSAKGVEFDAGALRVGTVEAWPLG